MDKGAMKYELVVGLEVHCQLNTKSKAFCGCSARFGNSANTNVCPVCLALPGALPVLNSRVVEDAVKLGLATGCRIAPHSVLARKNYFYPDLPKRIPDFTVRGAHLPGGRPHGGCGRRRAACAADKNPY